MVMREAELTVSVVRLLPTVFNIDDAFCDNKSAAWAILETGPAPETWTRSSKFPVETLDSSFMETALMLAWNRRNSSNPAAMISADAKVIPPSRFAGPACELQYRNKISITVTTAEIKKSVGDDRRDVLAFGMDFPIGRTPMKPVIGNSCPSHMCCGL